MARIWLVVLIFTCVACVAIEAGAYGVSRAAGDFALVVSLVGLAIVSALLSSFVFREPRVFGSVVVATGVAGLLSALNLVFLMWFRQAYSQDMDAGLFGYFATLYVGLLLPACVLLSVITVLAIAAFWRRR